MTERARLWICNDFLPVYRVGGWSWLLAHRGQTTGAAGGERATTAARSALSGLTAGLRALAASDPACAALAVRIETSSPDLASCAAHLTRLGGAPGEDDPIDNLDLWAQISAAAKGRKLSLIHARAAPSTPLSFAAAWAELARDKAKATGPFIAAIPRSNLAKAPGLPP